MYNRPNDTPFVKDGINNYIVNKDHHHQPAKNRDKSGDLVARKMQPGNRQHLTLRLSKTDCEDPWDGFEDYF